MSTLSNVLLICHPDFESAVAPLHAQIERLRENNRYQRDITDKWRQQLATSTAKQQSLVAEKNAISAKLDLLDQQVKQQQNGVHQTEGSHLEELRQVVEQMTQLHHFDAKRFGIDCLDQKTEHAEDQHKTSIVAELKLLQDALAIEKVKRKQENSVVRRTLETNMQSLHRMQATHEDTVAKLEQLRDECDKRQAQHDEDQRKASATLQQLRTLQVFYNDVLNELRELRDAGDA